MAITEDEERILLRFLLEHDSPTEKQMEGALEFDDRIDETDVAEWAERAEDRGLVERVVSNTSVRRWQITDAGRGLIGGSASR
jgi:DNA-binding MarR family transcriptional regulator